ncbi:molecular chaperone [Acinetobacter bohemicus]|uniref:Fimbrial chaperone protein n=1 Tax=Acinetobacter bohemicus TaxID=1435036 RepID=A0A1I6NW27_9GAMM|nr:molecular chaperone [Acinetobacter bohemicus]KAB0655097.1 molecular chaperone [Acinetobacter bohemicus]SFS32085.1 fimbrial chaperone protein [Acinetobacter bohemicus]
MNKLRQFICASIVSLYSLSSLAASLQVAPISVAFSPQEKAKEIWLTNTSERPIRAQTRVLIWSQVAGQDQVNPTRDLVASPSITEIKAGEQQLIRIIRIAPQNTAVEQTYRLLIDELPSSEQADAQTGLQLLLQYSIPVFIQPTDSIAMRNGLTLLNQVNFQYQNQQLIVKNNAKSHIRISELTYINPNGERIPLINGLVGYALAGQSMRWDIPESKKILPNGKFEARINSDGLAQMLPIQ